MKKIKLFFLRNKERFFRFLTVFMSCFVLSFSCFCVTSSADTVYNMSFSQPQLDEYSGYLEIYTSNWGPCMVWFRAFSDSSDTFVGDCDFIASVVGGTLTISLKFSTVISTQYYITGFVVNSGGYSAPLQFGGSATIGTANMGSITNVNAYNCSIGNGLSHSSPFTFVYGGDSVISQKIDVVNNILNSIDENTSVSAYYLEHIFNQIYSLNDKISITNKYLENLYTLIQREGNLTREKIDKILQYLEAAENGAYYNPSDDGTTSTVTNQQQKDEQVMQGTSTGRTEANNTINGLSGLLTTTGAVFKGSTALTKVFNLFAQSAYLAPILQISLVLGISSFVLGTAFIVVGKIRNKKE